jgi:hypothetical protein
VASEGGRNQLRKNTKGKRSAAERRQKGGKNAATQRIISGRRISGRSEAYLVLAFRSFLMKADLGKAGLIPLILHRQQQSHSCRCQAKQYSKLVLAP